MKSHILKVIMLSVLVFGLLPLYSANAVSYLPIVQCGHTQSADFVGPIENPDYYKPCTACGFFKMVKNTIDFMLYIITPVLATTFFIWAGFMILLSGANPGLYGKAKNIFTNTIYAVIIILCAWLITNTFIQAFGPANMAGNWWQYQCPAGLP